MLSRSASGAAEVVDLHRVIDDEIDRHARLHAPEVRAARGDRRAHRREVDEERHTGEVLKQDPPDDEGHLRRPRQRPAATQQALRRPHPEFAGHPHDAGPTRGEFES